VLKISTRRWSPCYYSWTVSSLASAPRHFRLQILRFNAKKQVPPSGSNCPHRRNRKLTFDQRAPHLPTGFPQERGRRRPTTAWSRRLCSSLPIAFFCKGHGFFLITTVRLQSTSFIDQTANRCSGDVILFRNGGQTHSRTAVRNNLHSVDIQRSTTDSSSFQSRSPHSRANSLDDEASFEFRYRSDDC
jgi:hypothetical protein